MYRFVTKLSLYVFLYQGFLTALLKGLAISLPVAPQTILTGIFSLLSFLTVISLKKINYYDLIILIASLIYILGKTIYAEVSREISDFTTIYWYLVFIILFISYRNKNQININETTNSVYWFGAISSIIAIAQFLGSDKLPSFLIDPPFTQESVLTTIYSYDLQGSMFNRPNGLFSNPIVYSSFLVILLEIGILKLHQKKSIFTYIYLIIVSTAILTSLSRAAIFGLLFILLAYTFKSKIRIVFVFVFVFVLIIFTYTQTQNNESFLLNIFNHISDRITGVDAFAQASNEEHISDNQKALKEIMNSPFFGYSFGYYAREDIITDGAAFILPLEFGIPLTLILYYNIIKQSKALNRKSTTKQNFPIYSIYYLVITSVINSSMIDRALIPILIILFTSRHEFTQSNLMLKK